jgi:hypothetical protein
MTIPRAHPPPAGNQDSERPPHRTYLEWNSSQVQTQATKAPNAAHDTIQGLWERTLPTSARMTAATGIAQTKATKAPFSANPSKKGLRTTKPSGLPTAAHTAARKVSPAQ